MIYKFMKIYKQVLYPLAVEVKEKDLLERMFPAGWAGHGVRFSLTHPPLSHPPTHTHHSLTLFATL